LWYVEIPLYIVADASPPEVFLKIHPGGAVDGARLTRSSE
jgi:hypothetical protein